MDARRDMSGLFVCDKTTMLPIAGILDRSQDNLVTGNSDSMSVTVHPFNAVLNRYGALLIQNDGNVNVPLNAAPSANSRIDIVYVKQHETRSPMSDGSDVPAFGVVEGTAAAVPVAPAVPSGALALAQVLLPAGVSNTAASGVVITQTYIGAALKGDMLRVQTSAQRDALPDVPEGTLLHNVGDGNDYVRENSEWRNLSNIKLLEGQWFKDWDVDYRCSRSGKIVSIYLKVVRKNPTWNAKAWEKSQILKFPDYLQPQIGDVNICGAGVNNSGFQLDPSGLYVRPFADIVYTVSSWSSASFSYTIK
jgi:hypothetical protein